MGTGDPEGGESMEMELNIRIGFLSPSIRTTSSASSAKNRNRQISGNNWYRT